MNADLETAKQLLPGNTIVLVSSEFVITSQERGVKALMKLIANGGDYSKYSVADKLTGKASALLLAKMHITALYSETLSQSAIEILDAFNITYSFGELIEQVLNKTRDDLCPMEKSVAATYEPENGYRLIKEAIRRMQNV